MDQLQDPLCFRQPQATVFVCPPGELPGQGVTALGTQGLAELLEQQGAAGEMELDHVFTGVGSGAGHHQDQAGHPVAEDVNRRLDHRPTRLQRPVHDLVRQLEGLGPEMRRTPRSPAPGGEATAKMVSPITRETVQVSWVSLSGGAHNAAAISSELLPREPGLELRYTPTMRTSFLFLPFAVSLSLSLGAQNLYVDANASAGGNGSGWSTAFDALQDALAAAGSGAEVWVAQGTYSGGFVIPGGVRMLGGFRTGDTRASQRDPLANKTILDGGGTQRVLTLGDKCVVDGFEVRNGNASSLGGGGALADGTSPTLVRCLFVGNRNSGGRGSTILVRNGGRPLVSNCVVMDNLGSGHAIDVDGAGGTYDHLTVFRNIDNGMHLQNGADPVITNSVFVGNTGRGICDFASGAVNQPVLENNLFWGNGVSQYHYRGAEYQAAASINLLSYASSNLVADPRFVDELIGDLRLQGDSPAVDAGGLSSGFDFAGNLRLLDGDQNGTATPDIGAREYTALELRVGGNISSGGTLEVTFDGSPGLPALLALGAYDDAGIWLGPYGSVHLDLGHPIVVGVLAVVPKVVEIPIPVSILPGTTFGLQAVSATAPMGFSVTAVRRVDPLAPGTGASIRPSR